MKPLYFIKLELDGNWGESYWNWTLRLDGVELAAGTNEYRFFARLAAQRAARRHAKGKDPVKAGKFPDNAYYYSPDA